MKKEVKEQIDLMQTLKGNLDTVKRNCRKIDTKIVTVSRVNQLIEAINKLNDTIGIITFDLLLTK